MNIVFKMSIDVDNLDFTWGSSTPVDSVVDDDVVEVGPVLENLECSSDIKDHSIHDFSIHLHKRREYSSLDDLFLASLKDCLAASNTPFSFDNKFSNYFTAETCCGTKLWTTEDVFQVISVEKLFFQSSTIIIKFPDKKLNKQLVTKLHKQIRAVSFLQSPFARRCCVTLKDSKGHSDILKMLNSTRFESGFLAADSNYDELVPADSDIDPFTLYVDNIPLQMGQMQLIRLFPNCRQITVGYTNKIYYTKRYAFIIFLTVKDAIKTFKKTNKKSEMLVRFRRFSGSAHLPTESEIKKCQSGIKNLQQGFPIVTDSGPPILFTRRNYKIVQNVRIKTEPSKKPVEIVLDDDDDINSNAETTDFEKLYEHLKQSRLQFSMLKKLE